MVFSLRVPSRPFGCKAAIKREKMQAGLQSSERELLRTLSGAKLIIFCEKMCVK